LNDSVSVQFQEELMSAVLEKISRQTGIAILYDEDLADQKVTGHYKDIKFSEAINRLFSEKNKSIQVFKNEKKIIVKTFGAKNFILALSAEIAPSDQLSDDSKKMTLAELEKMHRQQYKEYKERIADDSEVLEGGMTRSELKAMHAQQYKEYKKRIADDNEVLEGGMTRGELKAMHAQQYKQYNDRIADENEELEGGMTRAELKVMHAQQYKQYNDRIADENEELEGGMTRAELKVMHAQEYNNYKTRIANKNDVLENGEMQSEKNN
jgi:DNA-directed RNA polymerase subunit N (RpoN/RPB10)